MRIDGSQLAVALVLYVTIETSSRTRTPKLCQISYHPLHKWPVRGTYSLLLCFSSLPTTNFLFPICSFDRTGSFYSFSTTIKKPQSFPILSFQISVWNSFAVDQPESCLQSCDGYVRGPSNAGHPWLFAIPTWRKGRCNCTSPRRLLFQYLTAYALR